MVQGLIVSTLDHVRGNVHAVARDVYLISRATRLTRCQKV